VALFIYWFSLASPRMNTVFIGFLRQSQQLSNTFVALLLPCAAAEEQSELAAHPSEATPFSLPESIKLGLGDFIFYSVLVGRAAMYDMLTVFACYLAIVAGLGCTLLWLAVAHKALPALPISIAMAVLVYFVSRFVMEPVILPMALHLVYF
jgi:hypothetical protein